jgi:hypothetical protein
MVEATSPSLSIQTQTSTHHSQTFAAEQTGPLLGKDLIRVVREYDRRVDHRRAAIYSLFKRRRRVGARRDEEMNSHSYVDLHHPALFYLAITACLLSVLDAFCTLNLLENGSHELNPLLDYFLAKDVRLFFAVKFSITAFCILFLVMHKNYLLLNRISGLTILKASIFVYAVLISYEFSMLAAIHVY